MMKKQKGLQDILKELAKESRRPKNKSRRRKKKSKKN
jgi:hypothetical protein